MDLVEDLKFYHRNITDDDILEYRVDDAFCITIKFKNGVYAVYNSNDKSLRQLPSDYRNLTDEDLMREFSYRVRHMALLRGMTLGELANVIGINQSQLSGYITGRVMPSFRVIDKIARALNCSVDYFRFVDF